MRGIVRPLPSKESPRETIEQIQKVSRERTYGDGRLRELVKREFDTRNVNAALLRVHIVTLEQRHFRGPQPVMIGQLKEGTIALAGNDGKQPAHLVLSEEGDLGEWRGALAWLHEADSIPVLSDFCY